MIGKLSRAVSKISQSMGRACPAASRVEHSMGRMGQAVGRVCQAMSKRGPQQAAMGTLEGCLGQAKLDFKQLGLQSNLL
jgi:hypothetical protein